MEVKYDAKFLINQLHIEMYNSLIYSPRLEKYLLIPRDRIDITQNAEDIRDVTKDTMIVKKNEGLSFIPAITGSEWSRVLGALYNTR